MKWFPPSTRMSFVTSPSLHLNCWRAKSHLIHPPVNPALVSLCLASRILSKTVPSATTSMRLSHSLETWGCKLPSNQSNTCTTRTEAAPDELLSTPVISEKVAWNKLLKWHLVLTLLWLDLDTFMQVSVWKWCIWHDDVLPFVWKS